MSNSSRSRWTKDYNPEDELWELEQAVVEAALLQFPKLKNAMNGDLRVLRREYTVKGVYTNFKPEGDAGFGEGTILAPLDILIESEDIPDGACAIIYYLDDCLMGLEITSYGDGVALPVARFSIDWISKLPKPTSECTSDQGYSSLKGDLTDLIVFDGECVLCSHFFQFMLRHDTAQRFSFATAQSPLGQKLYHEHGLPTDDFETNLVFVEGRCYQRLDAFAAAMRALPGLWPLLGLCRFLPGFVKDPLYRLVARNRYRIFGRAETCMVPAPEIRARFLD